MARHEGHSHQRQEHGKTRRSASPPSYQRRPALAAADPSVIGRRGRAALAFDVTLGCLRLCVPRLREMTQPYPTKSSQRLRSCDVRHVLIERGTSMARHEGHSHQRQEHGNTRRSASPPSYQRRPALAAADPSVIGRRGRAALAFDVTLGCLSLCVPRLREMTQPYPTKSSQRLRSCDVRHVLIERGTSMARHEGHSHQRQEHGNTRRSASPPSYQRRPALAAADPSVIGRRGRAALAFDVTLGCLSLCVPRLREMTQPYPTKSSQRLRSCDVRHVLIERGTSMARHEGHSHQRQEHGKYSPVCITTFLPTTPGSRCCRPFGDRSTRPRGARVRRDARLS